MLLSPRWCSLVALVTIAACGDEAPLLVDARQDDARQDDAATHDDPPETILDLAPSPLTHVATARFSFHATRPVTFTCKVDGAAQPCSDPFDVTVTDGPHTFEVAATDIAGLTDPTPATAAWTLDTAAPDTTITQQPPALDNSTTVDFGFASEAGATFACRLDSGAFAACTSPHAEHDLAAGAHTFAVQAIDAAGNVDGTPAIYTWTIDTSTPDTTIDSGPSDPTASSSATFTFHTPSPGAGDTFRCALDGAAATPCTSPRTYGGLGEAAHTFTVAVVNAAGTADPTPATRTWTIDHTAPVVTITGGPTGLTNDAAPSFPFTTGADAIAIACRLDGGADAPCTSPYTPGPVADGPHTIDVRATDAAGNSAAATRSFTVDTQAPTAIIDAHPADPSNDTTAAFQLTNSDGVGPKYSCAIDGGGFAPCPANPVFQNLAGGAGTSHTLRATATDAAKNTGPEASFTWVIDTEKPTVVIDTTPAALSNVASPTFTFHSADGGVKFFCTIDSDSGPECTSPMTYTDLAGTPPRAHTFGVWAYDAAGNGSLVTKYTWTLDTDPPSTFIKFDSEPPFHTPSTSATFQFTSSQPSSTFTCTLDGVAAACNSGSITYTGLADGHHQFVVAATDPAGNVDPHPFPYEWWVDTGTPLLDRTPPDGWTVDYFPFAFHRASPVEKFQCSANGAPFAACTSPFTQTGAALGELNTFQVRWVDDQGNPSAPTTATWTPTAGLVLDYALDRDIKNRSILQPVEPHDGTGGTFTFVGGFAGGALAATKPVTVPGVLAPLSLRTGYTISAWVSWTSATPMQGHLIDTRGALGGCTLAGDAAGTLTLGCAGDPVGDLGTITAPVREGRWVNVLVRSAGVGSPVELFVDGSPAGAIANPKAADVFSAKQLGALVIGDTAAADTTNWLIDDVRVYDQAETDQDQCVDLLHGRWFGTWCQPLQASLQFSMDTLPLTSTGSDSMLTVADFVPSQAPGIYGHALALPATPDFHADGFSSAGDQNTISLWFYDDGAGNDGFLFNFLCEGAGGAIGCGDKRTGGMSAHVKDGVLTACVDEWPLPAARCADAPYTRGAWHELTYVDNAHDTGDGWADDSVDVLLDRAQVASIDLTDQGNGSLWRGMSDAFQMGPMKSAAAPGVLVDEIKVIGARIYDLDADVQCALFDGGTWDYATRTCALPPPPQ